jgi:hypothetical protein
MTSKWQKKSSAIIGETPGSEPAVADEHFAAYGRLLQNYGNRLVTKPSDRIVAILGLCQFMQEISGNEFVGGIWKGEYTVASLLWYIEPASSNERTRQFPSWSWASVLPDPESFVMNGASEADEEAREEGTAVPHWEAEVVSFDVQSDLAQTKVQGSIALRGRLGRMRDDESYTASLKGLLRTTPSVWMDLAVDKGIEETDLDNIWYFELVTFSGASQLPSKARLMLRQVVGTDSLTFERIGVYQHIIGKDVNTVETIVLI